VWPADRVREPATHGAAALRTVIAFAVLSVGVILLGVLWVNRRAVVPGDDDPSDVVRVGVVQGQTVGGYLSSSRKELAALTDPSAPVAGDTWALVSLDTYVPPGGVPGLLAGVAVAQVYSRVPLSGTDTPAVRIPVYRLPADVMTGMHDGRRAEPGARPAGLPVGRGDGGRRGCRVPDRLFLCLRRRDPCPARLVTRSGFAARDPGG
jgi:hypothetical protein